MIDLSYLRTTIGNDKMVIKEIIDLFIMQLPELKKNITETYQAKDWKGLKDSAHKAKNSFQILGLKDQADELHRIEILSTDQKENPEFESLINNFLNTCQLVSKEIKDLVI